MGAGADDAAGAELGGTADKWFWFYHVVVSDLESVGGAVDFEDVAVADDHYQNGIAVTVVSVDDPHPFLDQVVVADDDGAGFTDDLRRLSVIFNSVKLH